MESVPKDFYGKWELVPSLTENFEEFCDKAGIPEEQREAFKNTVTVVTIEDKDPGMRVVMEVNGAPISQDLTFIQGEPLAYKGMGGEDITSSFTVKNRRVIDHYEAVKDGKNTKWETERYIEGGMMVAMQKKDGVTMINKLKRIQ